ncbi:hypothetical protein [Glutamicibacter halophytocola]|uniref:hypothetical protein n=1 Tax=Glutamicibacter halophytocola TaxID=1933880 RepID=UPI0015C52FEC|nr:hypothetical protein [Glutamicibacter halophytocola]NQD42525.1 hypothetical protein [Glutamicibacter halophytocola]
MTMAYFDLASITTELADFSGVDFTHDPRTISLNTGCFFSDGEPVQVLARISANADYAIISDGGLIASRLSMYGIEADYKPASRHLNEVKEDFGLEFHADRYYIRAGIDALAEYSAHLGSALVALDSARLAVSNAPDRFINQLDDWLKENSGLEFAKEQKVQDQYGDQVKVSAVLESERGKLVIQAASGKAAGSLKTSGEHAYYALSALSERTYPISNRLVVLERTLRQGRQRTGAVAPSMARLTKRLTEVAHVSSFDATPAILDFMQHGGSESRDLVTLPYNQTWFR